jgi:hypothetical protein
MDKSLASTLVKASDHAFHPYGNSCGVLVYTEPGQGTVNDCREWAKNSGVAARVVNTRGISTEADISGIVPEADRVILIFDNFDRARSTVQDAIISYMHTARDRCMVIAIANSEIVPAVANNFNYKVTIGDRGRELHEAINLESDLLLKLNPLSEAEIFEFMKNLRGGTYFNMGMYSSIPVSRAYKSTIRIYKVIDLTAIVSGVSYENIGTTKDFRDRTGEAPGKSWYDHTPGFENKVGQKKSDPNSKYVLWDIKRGSGTCVRYYVVDIDTGAVTPVTKEDVLNSSYLTASEKAKLTPRPVEGFDKTTGELIENKTVWRTAAFDHIFWLSQAGKATQEYGTRFEEDLSLTEDFGTDLFMDAHANVTTDLDAILSGEVVESIEKCLEEDFDIFIDAHANIDTKLDDVLSGAITEEKNLKESYRRIVSKGTALVDNELFIDFD